ncbi:acyl carrier protein [Stieleria varia]|uniref:D-alanine--poly(Phosphoribitol) ligase subunit 2 n=1 Tax=Stieleria varia TaxID=2528005 RepID=A0A5C6AYF2_9BACT|nr:acyl carrier protein [Stieleria varia]TWU04993.1 D-alanine--poly(phosphoribitol) ligase subunit 2 [Stieleria varia]
MEDILIGYIKTEFLQEDSTDEIDADTDLLISGLLDSLGVMRLVSFIEKQFAISIPPQDVTIDHFMNARTIAAYIHDKQASAGETPA